MALTASQEALRLFKKSMGVADIDPAGEFFNEPIKGRSVVLPSQVWLQGDLIPASAPSLPHSGVSGVVQHYIDLPLNAILGTNVAFYHPELINAIPFNWDAGGTYNYVLKDNVGGSIPFGQNNWVVDIDAGVITFYGTAGVPSTPPNMPPTISFYKYVGQIGFGGAGNQYLVLSGSTLYLSGGTTVSSVDLSFIPTMVQELSKTHKNLQALLTFSGATGDGYLATPIPLSGNMVSGSSVNVLINGVEVPCGTSFSGVYGFFSPISGSTSGDMAPFSSSRSLGNELPGDYFYWRDNVEYILDGSDRIDFVFLVNKM